MIKMISVLLIAVMLGGCASAIYEQDGRWHSKRGFATGEFSAEIEIDSNGNTRKVKTSEKGWWAQLPGFNILGGLTL